MNQSDDMSKAPKRTVGRPRKRKMPEPIPDTPENIARALMTTPPPEEWEYLKDQVRKRKVEIDSDISEQVPGRSFSGRFWNS